MVRMEVKLHLRKYKCHKGFSWCSSVEARSKFRLGEQTTALNSLTAHTLKRNASCHGTSKQ